MSFRYRRQHLPPLHRKGGPADPGLGRLRSDLNPRHRIPRHPKRSRRSFDTVVPFSRFATSLGHCDRASSFFSRRSLFKLYPAVFTWQAPGSAWPDCDPDTTKLMATIQLAKSVLFWTWLRSQRRIPPSDWPMLIPLSPRVGALMENDISSKTTMLPIRQTHLYVLTGDHTLFMAGFFFYEWCCTLFSIPTAELVEYLMLQLS